MSNILKFILMAVAWLLFTLVTFYTCVQPRCCDGEPAAVIDTTDSTPAADNYAIYTSVGAATALKGSQWSDLLDRLKGEFAENPNQLLEVYGHYYASEPKPDGFANLGFLRADKIKQLLVSEAGIPADKIKMLARVLTPPPPATNARFDAGTFVWERMNAGIDEQGNETAQIVEMDEDNIKIRFPYNEFTKALDNPAESYLRKLAQRVSQTGERVNIVGHTDIRGSEEYNRQLGQDRADFVKGRLTTYGAPAGQIQTSSKGETQLEVNGDTEDAHRRNRRADITLLRN